jgi:chloramphenicol O-acetyltransferase type B
VSVTRANRPRARIRRGQPLTLRRVLGGVRRRLKPDPPRDYYVGKHDPARLSMGRHSYGRPRVITYDDDTFSTVTIGNFCSIAEGVEFLVDGNHRHDLITTSPLQTLGLAGPPGHNAGRGPITVEHDVWIGRSATVLSGVTIGTGAIVGAGSLVAQDVRPYAIVVGNPAREIRRRFSDADCEILLGSRWWHWPDQRVLQAADDLWSGDVSTFAERWL